MFLIRAYLVYSIVFVDDINEFASDKDINVLRKKLIDNWKKSLHSRLTALLKGRTRTSALEANE